MGYKRLIGTENYFTTKAMRGAVDALQQIAFA
jgi:hypothetical protein